MNAVIEASSERGEFHRRERGTGAELPLIARGRSPVHIAVCLFLAVTFLPPAPRAEAAPTETGRPNVIAAPRPDYPIEAFRRRLRGTAIVVLDIDPKTGKVGRVQLQQSTGSRLLDRLTLRAFTKWQFQPATVTRVAMPVRFSPSGVEVGPNIDPDRVYPFQGTVKAVDANGKTMTVKGLRGTDVIALGPTTKISRNGKATALSEAAVGSEVRGTAKVTTEMRGLAISIELE